MKLLHQVPLSVLLMAALAGCGASLPERLYTIEARAVADPAAVKSDVSVLVGPVTVPDLVDRPQMVLRVDASRVIFAEQSRWAEPLKSAIGRALTGNLVRALNGARVASYPQAMGTAADYQVFVEVQTFDSTPGKGTTLEMNWTVKSLKSKREIAGRSAISEPAVGRDPAELVTAHEHALVAVSREIAATIRKLP